MKPKILLALFGLLLLGFIAVTLRPAPVVVALWFEGSGSGAELGSKVQHAVLQALDYRNQTARRLAPYRYVPVVLTGLPEEAALERIRSSGAVVVLGGATSSFTGRISGLLERRGIPCISPTANSPILARSGDLLFRYTGPSGGEAAGALARLRGDFSRYVAVLDRSNPVYGVPQLAGFATGLGISPQRVLEVEGTQDLESVLGVLASGLYDGAVFFLPAFLTGVYAQRIAEVHPKMTLWTSDWGVTERSAALAGPGVRNLISAVLFPPRFPDPNHPFLVFLGRRYSAVLDPSVLDPGYGAVALLDGAVQLGGATPKGVLRGLQALQYVEGLTGTFSVDAAGDVQLPLVPVTLRDGYWAPLEGQRR